MLLTLSVLCAVWYVPICPRSRSNVAVITYAQDGAPCSERKICQNSFLEGDLGRRCWKNPDDSHGSMYCQKQGTRGEGETCWQYPSFSDTIPANGGQCRQGLYCWVQNSIAAGANGSVASNSGRGYCLNQLPQGASCTHSEACVGWCRELAPGISVCTEPYSKGEPCTTNEGCLSKRCYEGTCIEISTMGGLCDRLHRCDYSLDCINSKCGYHAAGASCNPSIPPYGGCVAHHYCNGNLTRPICTKIMTACNIYFNSCEDGSGCDGGRCVPLHSNGINQAASHVKFCNTGLFLDTSTSVPFCTDSKSCTTDAECELDAPHQLAYCSCEGSGTGQCAVAAGSLNCSDMASALCCSVAHPPSYCPELFKYATSIFGEELLATSEASATWCNERCSITASCVAWSFNTAHKTCSLRRTPYHFISTTETRYNVASDVLPHCTDGSAYDFTIPGMHAYCPVLAVTNTKTGLMEVPIVPAHPSLPYMLRRHYNGNVRWYCQELNLEAEGWATSLTGEVLWVPEGSLREGGTYTFGIKNESGSSLATVHLHVSQIAAIAVTTNMTHVRFCNALDPEYRVYVRDVLVIVSDVCVYSLGTDEVLLCVSDGVGGESCALATVALPELQIDDMDTSLIMLGRRFLHKGYENISMDVMVASGEVDDRGTIPAVSSDAILSFVKFLNAVNSENVLPAVVNILNDMTTRVPQEVGVYVMQIVSRASSVSGIAEVVSLLRLALLRHSDDRRPTKIYMPAGSLFLHRSLNPSTDLYITENIPHTTLDFNITLPIDVAVLDTADGIYVFFYSAGTIEQYPLPDEGFPVQLAHMPLPSPLEHPSLSISGLVVLLTLADGIDLSEAMDRVAVGININRTLLHIVDENGPQALLYSEDRSIARANSSEAYTVTVDDYQEHYPCPWPEREITQNIQCIRDSTQLGCKTKVRHLKAVQTGEKRTEYICLCRYVNDHPVSLQFMPALRVRDGGIEHFLSQKRVHTTMYPVVIVFVCFAVAAGFFGAAIRWEKKLESKAKQNYWVKERMQARVPARGVHSTDRSLSQIGIDLWSLNYELVSAAESDIKAWRNVQKMWWTVAMGMAHAWLYLASARPGYRLHQRVLVVFVCCSYVTYICSSVIDTCDDYLSSQDIFVEHVWTVSMLCIPGSFVFVMLCSMFSSSPLSLVSLKAFNTPPTKRVADAIGPIETEQIESVRMDLVLRPEELARIAHHEVTSRRIHTGISVLLMEELRSNDAGKLIGLCDVDFDHAIKTAKQSWLDRREGFVNWYAREEDNVLWVAGLKALATHDFQLAGALFHLSLLSDNPDLYIVFNNNMPPGDTRGIVDAVVRRNVIGRLWTEYYASTLLKMSRDQIYKCLLQSSITTDELMVLIGGDLDDMLFEAQGSRASMMCNGEVWSWQDGIRSLRDDPRGPQVVEAAQTFCWAPQELCSYTMLNSTVITGPVDTTTQAFTQGEGEAPFKPRHLVYGRLMVRYYCCVLSGLPGVPPTADRLTPQEWVDWTIEEEASKLTATQLPTLPAHNMPFRLSEPKERLIPNIYLTYLLNWKLAAFSQEVGTFCVVSPLEHIKNPFDPITRVNEIWKEQQTGSKIAPFVGLERCLKHLRENSKVFLKGGVYPSCKISRLCGSYYFPVTFYGEGDVWFVSRDLARRCAVHLDGCKYLQWNGVGFSNAMYGVDAASSYSIVFTNCLFKRIHQPVNMCSNDVRNKCLDASCEVVESGLGPTPFKFRMTMSLGFVTYVSAFLLAALFFSFTLYYTFSMSERHTVAWLLLSLFCVVQDFVVNQPVFVFMYLIWRRVFAKLTKRSGAKLKQAISSVVAANRMHEAGRHHPQTAPNADVMPQPQQQEEHLDGLAYSDQGTEPVSESPQSPKSEPSQSEPLQGEGPEFVLTPKARSLSPDSDIPPIVETSPPVFILDA